MILFSLFVGVIMLPILLQHIDAGDSSQQHKEERIARAATAEVAIVAIEKMEERLAADAEENIDNQLLKEVSSRVIGNLRRRADGRNDVESSLQEENLERRFRRRRCARACRAVSPARDAADQQRDVAKAAARSGPAGSVVDRESVARFAPHLALSP